MIKNFKQFLFIAGLLMIAAGAQPVGAAIWQWSTIAANNATADPTIGWAEGMSPSAVNDSARAMMAATAAWRNDISAVNTTAGSSTAFTLATSEGVTQPPASGQMLSFIAHATNGVTPTLAVDGGTAYPIWLNGSPVASGSLILGSPYRIAFSTANSAWLLEGGPSNPYSIALGAIMWSTAPTAPNSSFVAPSGQCISTTTYAAYWVQQGSPASGACPGGQFAIIDMRGRGAAALDTLNGLPANRLTSAANGCGTAFTSIGAVCANENQSTTLGGGNLPPYTPSGVVSLNSLNLSVTMRSSGAGTAITSEFTAGMSSGGSFGPGIGAVSLSSASLSFNGFAQGGSSVPMSRVQPTIGLIPYLRVL